MRELALGQAVYTATVLSIPLDSARTPSSTGQGATDGADAGERVPCVVLGCSGGGAVVLSLEGLLLSPYIHRETHRLFSLEQCIGEHVRARQRASVFGSPTIGSGETFEVALEKLDEDAVAIEEGATSLSTDTTPFAILAQVRVAEGGRTDMAMPRHGAGDDGLGDDSTPLAADTGVGDNDESTTTFTSGTSRVAGAIELASSESFTSAPVSLRLSDPPALGRKGRNGLPSGSSVPMQVVQNASSGARGNQAVQCSDLSTRLSSIAVVSHDGLVGLGSMTGGLQWWVTAPM